MCVSVLMPSCKSFMNKTKSMGPKMDPWGTPDRVHLCICLELYELKKNLIDRLAWNIVRF